MHKEICEKPGKDNVRRARLPACNSLTLSCQSAGSDADLARFVRTRGGRSANKNNKALDSARNVELIGPRLKSNDNL